VADCTGLENRRPERVRGFESHPLRQNTHEKDRPKAAFLRIISGGEGEIRTLARDYSPLQV
jgi:hypothetical protein